MPVNLEGSYAAVHLTTVWNKSAVRALLVPLRSLVTNGVALAHIDNLEKRAAWVVTVTARERTQLPPAPTVYALVTHGAPSTVRAHTGIGKRLNPDEFDYFRRTPQALRPSPLGTYRESSHEIFIPTS